MLTVLPTHFKLVPLCRTSESYFILIWDTVSKVAVNIYKHLYQPSSSSEYAEDQRNIMTFLRYLNFSAVLSSISRKNTNWSEEGNWLQEDFKWLKHIYKTLIRWYRSYVEWPDNDIYSRKKSWYQVFRSGSIW